MQAPLLFLSYSVKDRKVAAEGKQNLSSAGFAVFLAHEDIMPTDEWLRRIEAELKRCNVFVAILSENFRNSDWTDQEAGYALSRCRGSRNRCLILSLVVAPMSLRPHGFLKDFQALRLDPMRVDESCKQVAEIVEEKLKLTDFRKNRLISKFALSGSFRVGKENLKALSKLRPFSLEQTKRIAWAILSNNQIHLPPENYPSLRLLPSDHFEDLDTETQNGLNSRLSN